MFCKKGVLRNFIKLQASGQVAASAIGVPLGFYNYGQKSGKILVTVTFLVKL